VNLPTASVRLRLAIAFAAAMAFLLAVFSAGVFLLVRARLHSDVEAHARQDLSVVASTLTENPDDAGEIEEHGLVDLYTVRRGGTNVHTSDAWSKHGLPDPPPPIAEGSSTILEGGDGHAFVALRGGLPDGLEWAVAEDREPARKSLATLAWILAASLPVAIAAGFAGGWILSGRLLAPVRSMADAAEGITQERLAERLPVGNAADEFGRLATVVNAMLARIEDAFERLRRFTSDASHELRTPLTAIRIVGESALVETRDAAGYRQTISSILEETDRLTAMIEDLLVLAREDSDAYRSRFEPVDLGKLAKDVADVLRPVSDESGQKLSCAAESEVLVRGDRTILRQAIVNLVDNAIRYTPKGGAIELFVRSQDGTGEIVVADTGPGIAPEHREKVFERFYRIEQDRSRSTGGAGLGLPIARWAIDLHGGRLDLESEVGRGSRFRIRIPRAAS
jgi:heavy metal sensor kinase